MYKFVRDKGLACIYVLASFVSFYSASYRLPVGIKYFINLLILGLTFVVFLIKPNFEKASFCLKFWLLFFAPYLLFWMWSMGIWIVDGQTIEFILRGSKNTLYMFTNIGFLCAAVYLFDTKSVFYSTLGMTAANTLVIIEVGAHDIRQFIVQYFTLIRTFADDTGLLMRRMELHDLVFGWGAVLIFYCIHKEARLRTNVVMALMSAFFFTLAFKRIGILAVALAVVVFYIIQRLPESFARRSAVLVAIAAAGGLFYYLTLIKSGEFYVLAERYGINLMSRDKIFSYYEKFYSLTPDYLGRGIQWIYAYAEETKSKIDAIHNTYLQVFIETGFWCWFIWLAFELIYRVLRIGKSFGKNCMAAMMAMNIYVFITYISDNTLFYFPINVMYRMAVMVFCYEAYTKRQVSPLAPKHDFPAASRAGNTAGRSHIPEKRHKTYTVSEPKRKAGIQ